MNISVGDKLICKKRFNKYQNFFCQFQYDDSAFEINQKYEVIYIGPMIVSIKCGFLVKSVHGIHEENTLFVTKIYSGNKPGRNTPPYLYDYFYSPRELRKLKLLKTQRNEKIEKLGWKI